MLNSADAKSTKEFFGKLLIRLISDTTKNVMFAQRMTLTMTGMHNTRNQVKGGVVRRGKRAISRSRRMQSTKSGIRPLMMVVVIVIRGLNTTPV